MSKTNIEADRAAGARWLREIADKIESGEIKSVFTVAETHKEETFSRLSLLVEETRELAALAEISFWIDVYRQNMIQGLLPALSTVCSRGGEENEEPQADLCGETCVDDPDGDGDGDG